MTTKKQTGFIAQTADLLLIVMITLAICGIMTTPVHAEDASKSVRAASVPHPGTGLWSDVRQRSGPTVGNTQMRSTDAGVLINVDGQNWRNLRMDQLVPYSVYLLGAVLAILVLFRLVRGQIKIQSGRSGKKLLRFNSIQQISHWAVAITFVILGLTGVILLLGRKFLIPVIGVDAFSPIANVSKVIHDYTGPVFAIALLMMLVYYVKDNFYKLSTDFKWFIKFGGMLGGSGHVSAGRFNAGEKTWFWMAILGGLVVIVSGLVLDFPIFGQTRELMALAHLFHVISAIIILAASFGHMYLGTVGMEGALETMVTGYCDSNWAKEHHDEWYEEVKDQIVEDTTPVTNPPSDNTADAKA